MAGEFSGLIRPPMRRLTIPNALFPGTDRARHAPRCR
jgi:hypothetical protein